MNAIKKQIVLFDDDCMLCNWSVHFIIRHDPKKKFSFASLNSDISQKIINYSGAGAIAPNTVVLFREGKIEKRSTAVLRILKQLNGIWPVFYLFIHIPEKVRDSIYNWIARNRLRFFGKATYCTIPDDHEKHRFLS